MLARYPVASITSINENGTDLIASDYEVDLSAGIINRLRSDRSWCWARGRSVIRYVAGYESMQPPDIVQAVIMTVAAFRSQASRDPMLRSEETTNVERLEWQVGGADGLPAAVQALLEPHRAPAVF
jgi:hypothetical protein